MNIVLDKKNILNNSSMKIIFIEFLVVLGQSLMIKVKNKRPLYLNPKDIGVLTLMVKG